MFGQTGIPLFASCGRLDQRFADIAVSIDSVWRSCKRRKLLFAIGTGAERAKKIERVDPRLVVVVPVNPDAVIAHRFGALRLCRLENLKRVECLLPRPLVDARGARTRTTERRGVVRREMTVTPLDVEPVFATFSK